MGSRSQTARCSFWSAARLSVSAKDNRFTGQSLASGHAAIRTNRPESLCGNKTIYPMAVSACSSGVTASTNCTTENSNIFQANRRRWTTTGQTGFRTATGFPRVCPGGGTGTRLCSGPTVVTSAGCRSDARRAGGTGSTFWCGAPGSGPHSLRHEYYD